MPEPVFLFQDGKGSLEVNHKKRKEPASGRGKVYTGFLKK